MTRFSIDSNIFVYAVDSQDPVRQTSALTIISEAARCDCVLTPQSLAEFYHVVTRKRLSNREAALAQITDWMAVFPTTPGPTGPHVLAAAAAPVSFQFFDALLLATAAAAGCSAMISEDMQPGVPFGTISVVAAFSAEGEIAPSTKALLGT